MTAAVFHDADCGFCTKATRIAQGRWFATTVDFQAVQNAPLDQLGFTLDEGLATMHMQLEDGTLVTGHRAWSQILRCSRQPWPLLGRILVLPGIDALAGRVYAWIATHRSQMPGGTPACSLADRPVPPATS